MLSFDGFDDTNCHVKVHDKELGEIRGHSHLGNEGFSPPAQKELNPANNHKNELASESLLEPSDQPPALGQHTD